MDTKREIYKREHEKLTDIFKDVEESKRKLVEGLIDDAAYLKAENSVLKKVLLKTGMVKVHPERPELQKPVEAAKQYRQNINSYAVAIKTLSGVLQKNVIDEDDDMDEFE
ncbi:hypothetical protein VQL36_05495 [Chengkuizengella sp. SCS-71B]|uniref:hypothetical protein n=1 Tax=Chengkuizengella sp. SCS-71B TaxID=3115290 RepID=UPI0032C241FA